jgi:hypothetical protein
MGPTETFLWGLGLAACGIVMIAAGLTKQTPAMLFGVAGMVICHFVIGLTPRKSRMEDD